MGPPSLIFIKMHPRYMIIFFFFLCVFLDYFFLFLPSTNQILHILSYTVLKFPICLCVLEVAYFSFFLF